MDTCLKRAYHPFIRKQLYQEGCVDAALLSPSWNSLALGDLPFQLTHFFLQESAEGRGEEEGLSQVGHTGRKGRGLLGVSVLLLKRDGQGWKEDGRCSPRTGHS